MAYEEGREYDIIFAGGGTAACVAAGRLSALDPSLSILIIERGRNNRNNPMVTAPATFVANLVPTSENAIFYQAESEPALNGRARTVGNGGVLGGGSSINASMYVRAQGIDFDNFKTEGWGRESMIEYSKKLENNLLNDATKGLHGSSGPIKISHGTYAPNLKGPQEDFFAAANSYGIPTVDDLQDFKTAHGFARCAKYISTEGLRQDAAHCYIHPLIADGKHPNLHLLCESKVNRVVFEGKKAVGVEYEPEPTFVPQGFGVTARVSKIVQAKKLLVVSAGALGTPPILERSGIGAKDLLHGLGIEVVADLPGVGENYQDHQFVLTPYKTTLKEGETLDCLLDGRLDFAKAAVERSPMLGWNAIDVVGRLRPTTEEVMSFGPELKAAWDRDFANQPEKPFMLMGVLSMYVGAHRLAMAEEERQQQYVTMGSYTPYPYSRGNIHITSSDMNVAPKFYTGFLADENDIDLKKSVWAYKKGRDIFRRTNAFAGELAVGHPEFREDSRAVLSKGILTPGLQSVEDRRGIAPVEYDAEDDRAIEDFVRSNVETAYHSLGTCKMAPREKGGVVDKELNVYGAEGLKVADLSVIPENVGANTNNMALIVGEKVADIIGKELGLFT